MGIDRDGTASPIHTRLLRRTAVALAATGVAGTMLACAGDDDGSRAGAERTSGSAGAAEASNRGVADIVREVQPSVVAVLTDSGEGSGAIYDDDGVIVTNSHVVGDEQTVNVRFADGSRTEAEVVAADPVVDLAVVRTDRRHLPAATFADDVPEVGDLAVALGNPFGFENTATAGVVSGLERSIPGDATPLAGLIQTDAAISPGNSGGPLVGPSAEVIGINVAYVSPQGGAVSIGFAIPSPRVVDVADELLADGHVEHAFLGITPVTLTPQVAERYGIRADGGVVVLGVEPGGPADAAGIRPGDVVVGLDHEDVTELGDLVGALQARDPGEDVELTVLRDGDERTVDVQLGRVEVAASPGDR